jgi:hypothetical protein
MNDLGLTLAWLAVQVAILLAPALTVHALATRRGPAPGAWVATLSLGLVVALNVAAFMPGIDRKDTASAIAPPTMPREGAAAPAIPPSLSGRVDGPGVVLPSGGRGRRLAWLRLAWDRVGRGAAEPAVRFRPWGSTLAVVAMAGTAAGLLRLAIGLWAVALCRRRGRPVDDPAMTELLDELRSAMGCRRPVALREVPDLTTPATAGRRRPVVMLPDDWRSWSYAERRAVLAHELAHIIRGDYATGLVARLAVVLNYYHPLVRWMAARLQLQQEQAADAFGARFAGGPTRYLVALSSLALRQDGRSPSWPARAFLPARGTLIRRIAMLRDGSHVTNFEGRCSRARRLLTAFGLIGLTFGVATLRGPVRGAEDSPAAPAAAAVATTDARNQTEPSVPIYIREGADGVALIRPATALRHPGMDRFLAVIKEYLDKEVAFHAKRLKIDTSRPDFLKLRAQDIEWVTGAVTFRRAKNNAKGEPVHYFGLGNPAIRMVAPFDWLAFLRQWQFACEKVGEGASAYYRVTGKLMAIFGPKITMFLPDDRTIVFEDEATIRKMAASGKPASPAFLGGPAWERTSRGLAALAIKNQDDTFTKNYDFGRPADKVMLSLFKGIDCWMFGVDDADSIVLHADATSRGREASESVSRQIDSLLAIGRQSLLEELNSKSPEVAAHELVARVLKAMAANVRVEHTDKTVTVQSRDFATLADFAAIVEGEAQESKARTAARKEAKNSVKR